MSYVVRRIALTPPDRPLTFLTQYLNSSPFKMVRYQTSLLLTKLYQSFRSVTEILRGADNKIAKKGLELSVCNFIHIIFLSYENKITCQIVRSTRSKPNNTLSQTRLSYRNHPKMAHFFFSLSVLPRFLF